MKKIKCFVCKNELFLCYPNENSDLFKQPLQSGTFVRIYGNYGSIFDLTKITVAICDDCLGKGINEFIEHDTEIF